MNNRDTRKDPEDQFSKVREENMRRRVQGDAFWGGVDLSGQRVFIEGAIYHYEGEVESIQFGNVWLKDAYKVINNDSKSAKKHEIGRLSLRIDGIMTLALTSEVAWWTGADMP